MVRPSLLAPVLALAVVLGLPGCNTGGSGGGRAAERPSTTTAPATTTTAVSSTTVSPSCGTVGHDATDRSAPRAGDVAFLTAVEAGQAGCIDTVRFRFQAPPGQRPGYEVGYRPGPFQDDPSGRPITVSGTAFLRVAFTGLSGVDLSGAQPRQTYTGPRDLRPGGTLMVKEIRQASDFEGTMTWIVGLDGRHPFVVQATGGEVAVQIGPGPA